MKLRKKSWELAIKPNVIKLSDKGILGKVCDDEGLYSKEKENNWWERGEMIYAQYEKRLYSLGILRSVNFNRFGWRKI